MIDLNVIDGLDAVIGRSHGDVQRLRGSKTAVFSTIPIGVHYRIAFEHVIGRKLNEAASTDAPRENTVTQTIQIIWHWSKAERSRVEGPTIWAQTITEDDGCDAGDPIEHWNASWRGTSVADGTDGVAARSTIVRCS